MLTFSDAMTALHFLKLCRLVLLVVAMVATPVVAFAQGTGAPPTDLHRYPLPTYEEDWRALQGVDRTDVWDPVKFVPLSPDGTTSLSLGGEARVTYERFCFDGVRAIAHAGHWRLDAWVARPVDTTEFPGSTAARDRHPRRSNSCHTT